MLLFIDDPKDPILENVKDDPVRPELSIEFRTSKNKFVSVLVEEKVRAMVCVSLQGVIPETVSDLTKCIEDITTAVFYTIWSYEPGAGSELLTKTCDAIKEQYPQVERFVTLSPKTEMARKFHLKNGAKIHKENDETVNYDYTEAVLSELT